MDYELVRRIKESDKSTVDLVRIIGGNDLNVSRAGEASSDDAAVGDQLCIRKVLKGRHGVYSVLHDCPHPYLPQIYEVNESDDSVTVMEEYIEGVSVGNAGLSGKKLMQTVRELCDVLEFLHEKNIIHRDIKPSNILLASDGHIRLIDFDAARMPKEDLEQDTSLLGTRGYAPPEQYGFAQTDSRADIYALGVTLKQLMGAEADRPRCKKVLQKCTNLDPDKRYTSVKAVRRDLFGINAKLLSLSAAAIVLCLIGGMIFMMRTLQGGGETSGLTVLPAPENPHWDGETGVALWGNVPESGVDGEVQYNYKVFLGGPDKVPDAENDVCIYQDGMRGNYSVNPETSLYEVSLAEALRANGTYYFAVSAVGDGITYADSPYVMSDAFVYIGEDAPTVAAPVGLQWNIKHNRTQDNDIANAFFATWENMDDYADDDQFNVHFYDEDGNHIGNNIWSKKNIAEIGSNGVWFDIDSLGHEGGSYRFAVEVYTSRPNEYSSLYLPESIPEEAYSPWTEPETDN